MKVWTLKSFCKIQELSPMWNYPSLKSEEAMWGWSTNFSNPTGPRAAFRVL